MRNHSTSKLTKTMLSQLQENEYLRIKLIQLENVSREKDNFYLSIFREQQKVTQKVLSQLFLAEQKIKTLIKQRICNNWKEQYDNLATNITTYVKDVNSLIEEYRKTKQKLQQKTCNTNDLYDYYSSTLEECGKKFDQAQVIIEELNNNISELKQTVRELDQELGDKIAIIGSQNEEIQALRYEMRNNPNLQNLTRAHENDIKIIQSLKKSNKKFQKDNQAFQRSIKQMQKLILELKKEINHQQSQNRQLLLEIEHKDQIIREGQDLIQINKGQSQQIQALLKKIEGLNELIRIAGGQSMIMKHKSHESVRRPEVEFITTFNPSSNPLPMQTSITQPHYSQNLHQLHLKKILEQEEMIKNLASQLNFAHKNYERIEQQHLKLIQSQKLFQNREELLKKELQSANFKFLQSEFNSKQREDEVSNILLYGQKCKQEIQDWKLQIEGLYEEISNRESKIQQLQKQAQIRQKQISYLKNQLNEIQSKFSLLKQNDQQILSENIELKSANHEFQNQNSIFQQKLRTFQKEKQQSKQNFQNLLEQFQQFVKQTEQENKYESQSKKKFFKLCSFEVHETITIKKKAISAQQDKKINRKILSIEVENLQDVKTCQAQKVNDFTRTENTSLNQTKKFNLHSFQQKANPFYNMAYSPKIGDIFDSMHYGRKIPPSRW